MKNSQYYVSQIKKELLALKRKGVKEVIWKLDTKQKRDAVKRLGFRIEPWLYEIKTRPFSKIGKINFAILKEIHFAFKKGKFCIVRYLTQKELQVLNDYGVRYRPFKYIIKLN